MAFKGEVLIDGPDGPLEGPRENGTSLVYEFVHEVYLPYETETNRVQGSRRITAFSLTKDIDKITPILFQYCCQGTKLKTVTIVLYKIKESQEVPYFNYILENATIVSVRNFMPTTKSKENENVGHLEEVKFMAEKFSWNNEPTDKDGRKGGSPTFQEVGF
jgi:type VI secretion system secreted protein Hcp